VHFTFCIPQSNLLSTRSSYHCSVCGMNRTIFVLSYPLKLQLYTAVVVSTAIYASETWKSTRTIQNKPDVFHQGNLRKIIGVTWKDKVSNAEVLARTGQRRLQVIVGEGDSGLRVISCGWHQNAQPAVQLSGRQLTAEGKEVDQRRLVDQHLEKIYRQEESAGARKRQWQPTVCSGETCCQLFHEGPEDLSAK